MFKGIYCLDRAPCKIYSFFDEKRRNFVCYRSVQKKGRNREINILPQQDHFGLLVKKTVFFIGENHWNCDCLTLPVFVYVSHIFYGRYF